MCLWVLSLSWGSVCAYGFSDPVIFPAWFLIGPYHPLPSAMGCEQCIYFWRFCSATCHLPISKQRKTWDTKGLFGWRSRKVGEWKISRRMEKWENRKYLVFPRVCLVGGMEKWEGRKLFCLVEKKSGRIENVVYINWLLYPCYIIGKKYIYLYSLNNIKFTNKYIFQWEVLRSQHFLQYFHNKIYVESCY